MTKTLIALALMAGAAAAQAAPITLFSDNFDGAQTTAAGVTAAWSGITTTGSGGAMVGFSGNFLWNKSMRQASTLTLGGLSGYSNINVAFRLAFVDSWDGTTGSPAPDYFNVSIDGDGVLQLTCNNASGAFCDNGPGTNASAFANVFNSGWAELTRDVAVSRALTGASASITFTAAGAGWQAGDDESWAIDNVVVTGEARTPTGNVPEPGALALVGIALAGLALTRRRAR
ncbi:MAG TPA: PEP-CTERM sorting domain-containing protein [Aquabacterium sp.]|mgnify:FL=1|nr:PEP-CTERM sorting domain-containing protein [Aquabacterium sp.]